MAPTIQIIVVSCNEERKRLVTNQFKELGITIPYTFFDGYTPATSKEYLVDKHPTAPEFDTTQCCMRSHAGALHHYVTHYPESQFVLILEDDACLVRSFEAELYQVMNRWLNHISEIDFVSIGYQLANTDSGKHTSLCSDSNLYWNLSGTDGTGNVWGAIGYLVKRSAALSMASVLHKPTSKELRESIDKFLREDRKGMQFANKIQRNQSDVLMSVGWRQAVVFPLLAIEMPIESTISPGVNNTSNGIWENVFRLGSRKRDEFYSLPPTPTALIPPQTPPHTVASLIANIKKDKLVGIVVHDKASMFSNGIVQNAFFLYQCLEAIGYNCQFLCGEANPSPFEHDKLSVKQITTDSTIFNPSQYHTIITVTRRISPEIHALCQKHHVRIISLICGNCYVLDQEDFVRGLVGDSISFLGESRNIDEQWLIPSYHHSLEYMELIRKKPATLVPHLWAPSILKKYAPLALGKPESSMFYDPKNRKNPKINIIIMEPNMSMMKTAWMPLLACEKLHTLRPDLIEHVFVFNFPEHKNSWTMVESLSVGPKVRKFARKSVAEIMWHFNTQSECFPIFLSHQMLNSLNYIYYELLYYGFPLIHNSPDLDGCGYMYPENHISKCVEQLLMAYRTHNSMLETYKEKATRYLCRVDPFDATVQAAFDKQMRVSMEQSFSIRSEPSSNVMQELYAIRAVAKPVLPNKWMICYPSGGIASILGTISDCLVYAETYNRTLVIDTRRLDWFKESIHEFIKFNHPRIYCGPFDSLYKSLDHHTSFPSHTAGRLSAADIDPATLPLADLSRDYEESVLVIRGAQGSRNFSCLNHMTFAESVVSIFRERSKTLPSNYVGMHLRNYDSTLNLPAFVETHAARLQGRFFLASDNKVTLDEMNHRYGTNAVTGSLIVYDSKKIPIHRVTRTAEETRAFIVDVFVDLLLLAFSTEQCFSATTSGFGTLATHIFLEKSRLYPQLLASLPVILIDCFTFYNELDMLEYRLNVLDEVVDYFVIAEANQTYSGQPKQLYFEKHKDRFKKFQHKLIHLVVDLPYKAPDIDYSKRQKWINEGYQRNSLQQGLDTLPKTTRDLIMVSDLDEIPDPSTLRQIKEGNIKVEVNRFEMALYYYNMHTKFDAAWTGSKIFTYQYLNDSKNTFDDIRLMTCPNIPNGGWHLSYFGDELFIKNKIESFAHQELNTSEFCDPETIKQRMRDGHDLYGRSVAPTQISIKDNPYLPPKYAVYLTKFYDSPTQMPEYVLEAQYSLKCKTPSDINEHLPTLRALAFECRHITEAGVRSVVSSYAFATALKGKPDHKLVQVDLEKSPNVTKFQAECAAERVNTIFYEESDLTCPVAETDLLFIDTWHIYGHLKRELARWHSYAKTYIVLHDTTVDEWVGETIRNGWDPVAQSKSSGIPVEEIKKGLWPAVEEFLRDHPEWRLEKRYTNNNGLTILKRC